MSTAVLAEEEALAQPGVSLADMVAVPFGMIPPKEVVPLWPGWLARRHVTMVVGPGGTSKGLWTCDVAARVSTGRPWPGEPQDATREPEAVILVAPEDDPNEAVAWRLQAAGADTSLVFNLTVLPDGSPFVLPDSVPQLRAAMEQIEKLTGRKVGLVIIDPLMACVEKASAVTTNVGARKTTGPLEKLARELGPAVILTHHTVKSGAAAGSKGLTDAMRHVLRLSRPEGAPADTPVRVMSVEKSNMMSMEAQLRYALEGDGETCRVFYPADAGGMVVSRGYDVDPDAVYTMATGQVRVKVPGTAEAKPLDDDGEYPGSLGILDAPTWQLLVCEQGGVPKKLGGSYASEGQARDAAALHCGHALPWKPGDSGSSYAAALVKGGQAAAYTVFPNE